MTVADERNDVLLDLRDVRVRFPGPKPVYPVDGVSLDIRPGETLGLVGESGSGKSMTSLAIMGLIAKQGGAVTGGNIYFKGRDLLALSDREMMDVRGREISMIFQEPMTSLNPVYTIGDQIVEAIRAHALPEGGRMPKRQAWDRAVEMLARVGIPSPEKRASSWPHLLSGGMRQRAMIAMALSLNPELLIADEPTTALDVTIQAQILELIGELKAARRMSVLLITHNLGIVAEIADRVAVMYTGRILEIAPTDDLFRRPLHPYTRGLMESIPRMDRTVKELAAIPGMVPPIDALPPGCAFSPRCPLAEARCRQAVPPLEDAGNGHKSRCLRWRDLVADKGGAA